MLESLMCSFSLTYPTSQNFQAKLTDSILDPGSDQSAVYHGLPASYSATPRYLPTVTSFIPNIPLGSPLKVSIHSWEPPIASPETQALARQADQIYFEARVLLDGACIAYAASQGRSPR